MHKVNAELKMISAIWNCYRSATDLLISAQRPEKGQRAQVEA